MPRYILRAHALPVTCRSAFLSSTTLALMGKRQAPSSTSMELTRREPLDPDDRQPETILDPAQSSVHDHQRLVGKDLPSVE